MYRTLKEGGQVIITAWKRFAAGEVVRAAQQKVAPGRSAVPYPHEEVNDGEFVMDLLMKAGFDRERIRIMQRQEIVKEKDDVEGLRGFLLSEMITGLAHRGWEEEEKGKWEGAADEALKEEIAENGGMRFECFAVMGQK